VTLFDPDLSRSRLQHDDRGLAGPERGVPTGPLPSSATGIGAKTRNSWFDWSPLVKTRCSAPGGRLGVSGRIQIWMNRIGSVFDALSSECQAPEPSVIRWTEPVGSRPSGLRIAP